VCLVTAPEIAQHEPHQIQRVGAVGIEVRRPPQRLEGLLVQALIVEQLADVEIDDRAVRIECERALEPLLRLLETSAGLLGERELHERANVIRVMLEELGELADRFRQLPEQRERSPELPARLAVGWATAEALAQVGDSAVIVPGVEVRDLEVALRDLHLGVELESAHERRRRLGVQSLVVIEDAEVVVRPGVRRIDPPGE
jgi:hypothetical protein